MIFDRVTYPELAPPAVNPPSAAGGATHLTGCGGVPLPEPASDAATLGWLATDVALRRMELAVERFRDAEQALADGMAALAAIPVGDPRRHFTEAMLAPLERASIDVGSVLDSMNQVGVA